MCNGKYELKNIYMNFHLRFEYVENIYFHKIFTVYFIWYPTICKIQAHYKKKKKTKRREQNLGETVNKHTTRSQTRMCVLLFSCLKIAWNKILMC